MWADEETITLSEQGYTNGQTVSSTSGTNIALNYTDGGTATAYYNAGTGVRVYAGGKISVTADGKTITNVSITHTKEKSPTVSWSSNGSTTTSSTGTPATWEGSATEVDFNVANKGHVRVQSVTVTYVSGGGGGGSSAVATTTTISATCITNTDVYEGTAAGSLTAAVTETESGDAVAGTVTWSGDNDDVATIDASTGAVTLVAAGTVTFTANYAGVEDEYEASSDTYKMTVTDSTPVPSHTATFSVNGATSYQEFNEGAAIEFPANPGDVNGKTFVGWVTEAIEGTTDDEPAFVNTTTATMGESDVTYYAVFANVVGNEEANALDITATTDGVPSSYGTANKFTEYTLGGVKFQIMQMYKSGGKLQWRAAGNSSGTGTMYNSESLGKIDSIVLTYNSSDTGKNFTLKIGNSANPTTGESITPSVNGSDYTFDCSSYDYDYFVLTNGSSAGYLDKITINYTVGSLTITDYCTTVAAAVAVTGVSVDATASVNVGETTTLTATVSPDNATNKNVTWTSSDETIATVDANGVVTGVAAGEATITVTSVADNTKTADCTVTVTTVAVTSVSVDATASVNVGKTTTLTATVSPDNATNKNVTWTSSDEAIATVDASGVVTGVTAGTATITVKSAEDASISASCTVTVSVAPGTAALPYTVAQAIDAIDNGGNVEDVYVSGIVSTVATKVNSSGQMSYYISDDGTKTSELQAYNGKGLNNTPFSATTDVELYDRVTIVGSLTKYGDIYEFSANNYLVTQTHRSVNTITVEGGTSKNIDLGNSETSVTLSATAANGATVTYVVDTENSTLNADDYTFSEGMLTVTNANSTGGNVVIIASAEGDIDYYDGTETITVTVIPATKTDAEFELEGDSDSTPYGTPLELVYGVTEGYDGTITCTSSNDAIADVAIGAETITFTPKAVGTAVFTISVPETDLYNAAPDATFTLTVTAPEGSIVAPSAEETETFDFSKNGWGLPTSSSSLSGSYSKVDQTVTISGTGYYYGSKALLLGKSGAYVTLPAFSKPVTQIDVVGVDGASSSVKQNIFVGSTAVSTQTTGATTTNEYEIDSEYQDAGTIYTLKVTSAHNTQIASINVHMYQAPTTTVTLNKNGLATYCSVYPMDFKTTEGYTAWRVSDVDSNGTITFEKITGVIKGGQGVLLYNKNADGEQTSEAIIKFADGTEVFTSSENMLVGSTAPTYITATSGDYTNFGLKGDAFIKANDGVLPANKAYLPILTSLISSTDARLSFVFNDDETTTGIADVRSKMSDGSYYDLQGRKVNGQLPKGLYIVNGKKMVVK